VNDRRDAVIFAKDSGDRRDQHAFAVGTGTMKEQHGVLCSKAGQDVTKKNFSDSRLGLGHR
jgi:hypothetical protein